MQIESRKHKNKNHSEVQRNSLKAPTEKEGE